MKLSQLFGKKVYGKGGSGYVLGVNAAGRKIEGFTCADADDTEFFIPLQNVKSVKAGISYTERGEARADLTPLRLGKPVFDGAGNFVGKLTDMIIENNEVITLVSGNKKIPADKAVCGDAVIVNSSVRFLKSDVKRNGKTIFRKGTPVTEEIAQKARLAGEYVQTNLKTI